MSKICNAIRNWFGTLLISVVLVYDEAKRAIEKDAKSPNKGE